MYFLMFYQSTESYNSEPWWWFAREKGRISSTTKCQLYRKQTVCTFLCLIKALRLQILDLDVDLQDQNHFDEGAYLPNDKYEPY